MYRDYKKDRLRNLKTLNEGTVNPLNLDHKSNPCLDVYNWDGKDELPTTIKTADLDTIIKKIANKEDESGLKKTEVFENAFDKVFGKSSNVNYRPYDDISDTGYRDSLLEAEYKTKFVKEDEDKEKEEDTDNTKDLDMELDNIKSSQDDLDKYEDDDDDEEEDDDDEKSMKENYMGFNLDEDVNYDEQVENLTKTYKQINENISPISLLEDSEDSITNLDALLEQTQLIEDEVDSILNYNIEENASDFSDTINESEINEYLNEDIFLESSDFDDDLSEFLDEDLM